MSVIEVWMVKKMYFNGKYFGGNFGDFVVSIA